MERQQFHREQLKLAEMRARANQLTSVPPPGAEIAVTQPQAAQVSMAGSPQSSQQFTTNQPPRVPTSGIYWLHYLTWKCRLMKLPNTV